MPVQSVQKGTSVEHFSNTEAATTRVKTGVETSSLEQHPEAASSDCCTGFLQTIGCCFWTLVNFFAIVFCCRSTKRPKPIQQPQAQPKVATDALLEALHRAALSRDEVITVPRVQTLLLQGANPSAQDERDLDKFPLQAAYRLFRGGRIIGRDLIAITQLLLHNGADVNMLNGSHENIVQCAYRDALDFSTNDEDVQKHYFQFIKMIIECDRFQFDPKHLLLIHAIENCPSDNQEGYGWEEIVKVLIEKCSDLIHEETGQNDNWPLGVVFDRLEKFRDPKPYERMALMIINSEGFGCDKQVLDWVLEKAEIAANAQKFDKVNCWVRIHAALHTKSNQEV